MNDNAYLIGVTKSGSVQECREALEELYEFLIAYNIGDPNAINSILDKFTEAGFMDQVKQRDLFQFYLLKNHSSSKISIYFFMRV